MYFARVLREIYSQLKVIIYNLKIITYQNNFVSVTVRICFNICFPVEKSSFLEFDHTILPKTLKVVENVNRVLSAVYLSIMNHRFLSSYNRSIMPRKGLKISIYCHNLGRQRFENSAKICTKKNSDKNESYL